jgi:hypothetical protein
MIEADLALISGGNQIKGSIRGAMVHDDKMIHPYGGMEIKILANDVGLILDQHCHHQLHDCRDPEATS